jgi:hypothetical protein
MVDPNPNDSGAGQTPPPQANPSPVTLDTLQKQVEDLMTLTKQQKAENDNLKDSLERTTGMLQTLAKGGGPSPSSGRPDELQPGSWDDVEKLGVPKEAAERIAQAAETRVYARLDEQRKLTENFENLRRSFYTENPDLKDHEPIVQYFANQVQALFPTWTTKQAFGEVAKRTREYIQSKLKPSSENEPPPVLPGGRSLAAGGGGGPNPPLPQDGDDIRDEIENRQRLRARGIPSMQK